MGFFSSIFKPKNSIKNGGTGTFFGKLIRGASSAIPIVGSTISTALNESAEKKMAKVAEEKAIKEAQNAPADSKGDYPVTSAVFPNGSDPTTLNAVNISAQKSTVPNYNFDLDWKNGKVSTSTGNGVDNNVLLYGLLGLGALMLLKNK